MNNFPTGTVTFLFTDIEGSTKIAQAHRDAWESLRMRHHEILQGAIEANQGYVFQIVGDEFCAVFDTASNALKAAVSAQKMLHGENWNPAPIRVRMGIHTGAAQVGDVTDVSGGYTGYGALARASRIMSAGHGGQVLLSGASAELVRSDLPEGVGLRDLRKHRLKGLLNLEHLWQVEAAGIAGEFPPLKTLNIGRKKEIAQVKEKLKTPWIIGGIIGVVAVLAAIFWPKTPPVVPAEEPTITATMITITETPIPTETESSLVSTSTATTLPATATSLPKTTIDAHEAEMVLIPAGSFLMGSDDGEDDEGSLHKVTLGDFYIDKYEVTNAQYEECVDDGSISACELPSNRRDYLNSEHSDHPVFFVNWDMAAAYCEWRGARLPTEAEWEKAARGTETDNYPWGDSKLDAKKLNFCDLNCTNAWQDKTINDKYTTTSPVGNYENGVTKSGIYDLAGNVWEWVNDWYVADYYTSKAITDPPGPETGIYRVLRGGSWFNEEEDIRVYNRYELNPVTSNNQIGFRCAMDVPAE